MATMYWVYFGKFKKLCACFVCIYFFEKITIKMNLAYTKDYGSNVIW